ncbi:hypothetical protein, partial [Acinetobacter baumannii]|uniref:hypothetical protein n=1 Tax=Acinetobacter baumannii TaxID=470 RepID=UPI001D193FFA
LQIRSTPNPKLFQYKTLFISDELGTDGSFNAQVAFGPDAVDGTVVNVNGTNYTVTAADISNGYITAILAATAADPVTGQIVIHAE